MTDTLRNMPRYIRNTDAFGWQGADGPNGPWRSIAPPQSGTPWQTNASDRRLTPEQIDSFLAKYTDPADARQFLVEAGLIDKNGELAGPYRPSPMDDLRQASADVSGVEVLSPAAQAVWDAVWQLSPFNCKSHEDRRRQQIAAALRAAEDRRRQQIAAALRAAADQLPGVRWDGCIQPDAEISIGINWSRDALHALATELERAAP